MARISNKLRITGLDFQKYVLRHIRSSGSKGGDESLGTTERWLLTYMHAIFLAFVDSDTDYHVDVEACTCCEVVHSDI